MGEVKPLFSTKTLLNAKQVQTKKVENTDNVFVNKDYEHEIYLLPDYKKFAELMPTIEQGKSYDFVSFGQFSLKHVVFHILKLIGPSNMCSTTYGMGPTSARAIVDGLHKGIIQSFHFVYDWKIKQYKQEAHFLCESNFPVKITSIHAKVTTFINENWGVTITGSMNWSDNNKKIETISISTNRLLAEYHSKWIKDVCVSKASEPSEIYKEIYGKV